MAVQTLELAGKRFVVIPEAEYKRLKRRVEGLDEQELGDIAEAKRREREPSIPLEQIRKRLKL